jgi:hypothetical protein
MANQIDNRLIVVGLKENPEDFARELEIQIYGHAVPHESGNLFVEVVNGNFDFTTKWAPKLEAVIELSKRKDHDFLLDYGGFETQRRGQVVVRHGDVRESIDRIGYSGLFDEIERPMVDLFAPYLRKRTLAECATGRLHDAMEIVHGLIGVLDDERFKNSPSTPYSDVRDQEKTEEVRAALAALVDSMETQIRNLNFKGVLLEEADLKEGLVRQANLAGELMATLGPDCLVPERVSALRFAILPFAAAVTEDPCLVILPILHYVNADRLSGRYERSAAGSFPPIEWKARHGFFRRSQVKQISRLHDENQTPYDIDIIMQRAGDHASGLDLYRASSKARWAANPGLVIEVEQAAIELSRALEGTVTGKPGVRVFPDFRAVDAALFPKTIN